MKVDEVLDAAADDILINGHHKGDYYKDTANIQTSPACVIGAVSRVAGYNPVFAVAEREGSREAYLDARVALVRYLQDINFAAVTRWNDDPKRTAGEVMDTLRTVAKEIRENGSS